MARKRHLNIDWLLDADIGDSVKLMDSSALNGNDGRREGGTRRSAPLSDRNTTANANTSVWPVAIRTSLLLIGVAGLWIGWPTISRAWLRSQLVKQIDEESLPSERILALASLSEFLPETLPQFMEALESENEAEIQIAHQALDLYLNRLLEESADVRRGRIQALAAALDARKDRLNRTAYPFASALASRVFSSNLNDSHATAASISAHCENVMRLASGDLVVQRLATQNDANPKIAAVPMSSPPGGMVAAKLSFSDEFETPKSVVPTTLAERSLEDTQKTLAQRSISDGQSSVMPSPLPTIRTQSQNSPSRTLTTYIDTSAGNDMLFEPESIDLQMQDRVQRAPDSSGLRVANREEGENRGFSYSELSNSELNNSELSNSDFSNSNVSRYAVSDLRPRTANDLSGPTGRTNYPLEQPILGLSSRPEIEVIRLLTSVQPKISQNALIELERRGYTPVELESIVRLARGSTVTRISELERVFQSQSPRLLSWLRWMAEEGDREVRMRAIVLMGSIQSADVQRTLRLLSARERDVQVNQQIQRALMVAGSVSNPNRRIR